MIAKEQLTFECLGKAMNTICFKMGKMTAKMEDFHTCELSYLRYPWPLDQNCSGCRHQLENFVEWNHLEMAYRLFGWNAIINHMEADVKRRSDMAAARRNMGGGI